MKSALHYLEADAEKFMGRIAEQQKLGGVASIEEMYDAALLILHLTRAIKDLKTWGSGG